MSVFSKISFSQLRRLAHFRQSQELSLFNKIILWLNYFSILALLVGVIAKYISPVVFWLPAFFGLAFPFVFLLNILFILYWSFQFKPPFIFGLVAIVVALPTAFRYIQVSSTEETGKTRTLTVTSYNCMLFDLYNWGYDKFTRPKIFNSLAEINSDILCLQEFYTSEQKGDYNNIDTVRNRLKLNYFHTEYTSTLREQDHWGIATFSRYPIINQGKILFKTSNNNICIFSDIVTKKDTIRVYNIHLQSISFSRNDNRFLDDIVSERDANDRIENSKNILRRLKRAFVNRAKQVQMIKTHMKTCPYKIILCGDFNDTAASYAYEELSEELNDAFLEKGSGFGKTYAGKWPQFRIDYVLHDKKLKCKGYTRGETFTDHFPITASFEQ